MTKRAKAPSASPFRNWRAVGLPAFAAALAPWQDKITQASLISEWFKPNVTIIASVVSPLCCFVIWSVGRSWGSSGARRLALAGLLVFLVTTAGCLTLMNTLDTVWFPGPDTMILVRVAWAVTYLTSCAAFGIAMVGGLLVLNGPDAAGSGP